MFIGSGETGVLGENYKNCNTPTLAAIATQWGRTKKDFAHFIVAYYRMFRPANGPEFSEAEEEAEEEA